jgi:uncharacterized protein YcbK (DUF882 family)
MLGLAGGLLCGPPAEAAKRKQSARRVRRPAPRKLRLFHVGTEERFEAVYWADGNYSIKAMLDLARFLRDTAAQIEHPIDPALADLLHDIQRRLNGEMIIVTSGFRTVTTNVHLKPKHFARDSFHLQGKAVDVAFPDFALEKVRDVALGLRRGGVGYYPKANYLHVDTGPVREWEG